ncbi:hypothetical protein SLE2022_315770 [Rubroshorea leprosula]
MARNTPPLNDMMASIRRYPIAELTPKSTADATLAGLKRRLLGRRVVAAEMGLVEVRDLKRIRRSSMYW